jgi:hypothetical protein
MKNLLLSNEVDKRSDLNNSLFGVIIRRTSRFMKDWINLLVKVNRKKG